LTANYLIGLGICNEGIELVLTVIAIIETIFLNSKMFYCIFLTSTICMVA